MLQDIRFYLRQRKDPAWRKKHWSLIGVSPLVVVALIGAYVGCQAVADVGVTKFMQLHLGKVLVVTAPCGGLMYCFTYTIRDLIHKRLGKSWARAAILVAASFNIFQAAFLWAMSKLPSPGWFELGPAWNSIFGVLPFITAASIIAEVISELVDTEVYQAIWMKLGSKHQWFRVLGSNVVGMFVDSILFAPLAFTVLPYIFGGTPRPLLTALAMGWWGKAIQATVMLVSLPWIYIIKEDPAAKDR